MRSGVWHRCRLLSPLVILLVVEEGYFYLYTFLDCHRYSLLHSVLWFCWILLNFYLLLPMRLFNFRFIASVGLKFILWNLEVFDKRCVSCRMHSFLSIITNVLFLSVFRMMMLSFLLNSLILLYSFFVIRSLVKSLLSLKSFQFTLYSLNFFRDSWW